MKIAHFGEHAFRDAATYDRRTHHLSRKLYAKIVQDVGAAGLPDDTRLLDVGTGPGRIPRQLAAEHPTWAVEGVDLEPKMIEFARSQDAEHRVTFTVGDVAALPYDDASFDLIISSASQHHWSDVDGAIRELRRVLRPGGRLWIYDARWVLKRAERAATPRFGAVRREPVRTTRWPFPIFERLVAELGVAERQARGRR